MREASMLKKVAMIAVVLGLAAPAMATEEAAKTKTEEHAKKDAKKAKKAKKEAAATPAADKAAPAAEAAPAETAPAAEAPKAP